MIPGIFITGTGTDVGKTVVTAGVLRWLLGRGVNAIAMKPVQTGAKKTGAKREASGPSVASDIEFVLQAAGLAVDEETRVHVSPYVFEPACSPHLAARMAGTSIQIERILATAQWLAGRYEVVVVEGAGGLMVPINECETMLDLAVALEMPALLVGHSGLGTINHVLLSLEAMRRRGQNVLGVVLNDTAAVPAPERFIHEDNVRAIESFGQVRVLARVPYLGEPPDLAALDASLADCDFLKEFARELP